MQIVGAAALIAVGIVVAAALYGRSHGGAAATTAIADLDATTALQAALTERGSALDRREDGLARRESALSERESQLETEQGAMSESRREMERRLEHLAGMSAAKAKQLLLKDIEDQAQP